MYNTWLEEVNVFFCGEYSHLGNKKTPNENILSYIPLMFWKKFAMFDQTFDNILHI
jgi:hypothetical protein